MRRLAWIPVLLLFAVGARELRADDLRLPGVEADAESTAVLETWIANRYALGRAGSHRAACTLWIEGVEPPKPRFLEGDFVFDYFRSEYDWRVSKGEGVFERGWWRAEFEALQLDLGLLLHLRGSRLTAHRTGTGTDVHVRGPSALRRMRFDADGVLRSLETQVPDASGTPHAREVRYTYDRWNGRRLLRRFVLSTRPGAAVRAFEAGTVKWVRVRGRPVPVRMDLEVGQGSTRLEMTLWMRDWRFGAEVGPKLAPAARKAVERYEETAYRPGLWRYVRGTCRVIATGRDGEPVRGMYHFDGERGRVTWSEGSLPPLLEGGAWRGRLDQLFQRYWLRAALGPFAPSARTEDGRTTLVTRDHDEGLGGLIQRAFVFDANGTLAEIRSRSADATLSEVHRFGYQRVLRTRDAPPHVPYPHHVPVRIERVCTSEGTVQRRTIEEIAYDRVHGLQLPSRLTLRVVSRQSSQEAVVVLRDWSLVREALDLAR